MQSRQETIPSIVVFSCPRSATANWPACSTKAEWLQSGFKFNPGRWYYLATTFQVKGADTEVNAFSADLSEPGSALNWTVRNRIALGAPAAGPLGIGKGFNGQTANAYPWPGQLGLVGIYDCLLDQKTLETHRGALTAHATTQPQSPLIN